MRTNTVAVTATGSWSIYKWGWQFSSSEALDEAYVPFFGAFRAARDDARSPATSFNPLGMLWPEMDDAFVTSGGENGGPTTVARHSVLIIGAG
jgi:hypothetical protein